MPKGMMLKFRARMSARKIRQKPIKRQTGKKASIKSEEQRLEVMERRLERVADEVTEDIEKIERLKDNTKKHEFGWIKGKVTILLMQDFVGATFGAIFFAFTQEVWEIAQRLNMFSIFAILMMSMISGFSLIYLSRRRKSVSIRIYHTAMLRGIEIYVISFLASLLFVLIVGVFGYSPVLLFKGSVLIALPAVISAATADLLFY